MILVFPGQGAQSVGMGKDFFDNFAEARNIFAEVDEALKMKLSDLIFHGPSAQLDLTINTQPALLATTMAMLRVLEKEGGIDLMDKVKYVAGHSAGEYIALCAVGAITVYEAAQILRIRGQAMQNALPIKKGGMIALLGSTMEIAATIARQVKKIGICEIANDNCPGQIVLSGEMPAIEEAGILSKKYGVKRAVKLSVSSAFHSSLMLPAARVVEKALRTITLRSPGKPLIANCSNKIVNTPIQIKRSLVAQISKRVRWREMLLSLKDRDIKQHLEVGPSTVLTGFLHKTKSIISNYRMINSYSFSKVKDLPELLQQIN